MTEMSWAKYCELAARTESIPENYYSELAPEVGYPVSELERAPHVLVTRLLHAQLGLQTEITEYQEAIDLKNKIEELGDTYWYLALISNAITPLRLHELTTLVPNADEDIYKFSNSKHWLAEMADVLKRTIYYGEDLYKKNKKGIVPVYRFMVAYWGIIRWIEDQTMQEDIPSVGELCALNIEKLSKRYPDLAFKPSDALIRDVEKELNHIPEEYVGLETQQVNGLTVEAIVAEPASESIEMLDFPTFRRTLLESFVNFTDMLVFGGNFFSALDNYYSENGCLAMSKAYKTGYRELLAYRPSQAVEAIKDIWGVLAEWGPKHRLGIPHTKTELLYMMNHQKELCLCPSMLKK